MCSLVEESKFVQMLAEAVGAVDSRPDSCEVPSVLGRSFVKSAPLEPRTDEGVYEVVTVRTELPDPVGVVMDDDMIDSVNRFASLGALIRHRESRAVSIISRLSLYRGQESTWHLLLPIVGTAALVQGTSVSAPARFLSPGRSEDLPTLPGENKPSCWGAADFKLAEEMLRRARLIANGDDTGLVVEFPWEPGAVSAVLGDVTSLLTFSPVAEHPVLGNGLLCKLELPAVVSEGEEHRTAEELNLTEARAVDAPPFFGAWCTAGPCSVAHTAFWPNMLHRSGVVVNLSAWMLARNKLARAFINTRFERGA